MQQFSECIALPAYCKGLNGSSARAPVEWLPPKLQHLDAGVPKLKQHEGNAALFPSLPLLFSKRFSIHAVLPCCAIDAWGQAGVHSVSQF